MTALIPRSAFWITGFAVSSILFGLHGGLTRIDGFFTKITIYGMVACAGLICMLWTIWKTETKVWKILSDLKSEQDPVKDE